MSASVVSKLGFHSIGDKRGNKNEYRICLDTVAAAGRYIPLIKCRDDYGAAKEAVEFWGQQVVTVGANTQWDGEPFDAPQAAQRIKTLAAKNPHIQYWEYTNELDGLWQEHADFYIKLLPLLSGTGLGVCMWNCASGTPKFPQEDPEPYREIARACKFAKDNGYKALLGVHEYFHPTKKPTIGRYKILADYLAERDALLPIVITEFGWETNNGREHQYLEWLKQADQEYYIGDDRVKGVSIYSLGGRGWQASNYATILPELGEYIATVQPAPQPTPEPTPEPIETRTIEERVTGLERRVTRLESLIH